MKGWSLFLVVLTACSDGGLISENDLSFSDLTITEYADLKGQLINQTDSWDYFPVQGEQGAGEIIANGDKLFFDQVSVEKRINYYQGNQFRYTYFLAESTSGRLAGYYFGHGEREGHQLEFPGTAFVWYISGTRRGTRQLYDGVTGTITARPIQDGLAFEFETFAIICNEESENGNGFVNYSCTSQFTNLKGQFDARWVDSE